MADCPVRVLAQFSGTPNTEQFRLVELEALLSLALAECYGVSDSLDCSAIVTAAINAVAPNEMRAVLVATHASFSTTLVTPDDDSDDSSEQVRATVAAVNAACDSCKTTVRFLTLPSERVARCITRRSMMLHCIWVPASVHASATPHLAMAAAAVRHEAGEATTNMNAVTRRTWHDNLRAASFKYRLEVSGRQLSSGDAQPLVDYARAFAPVHRTAPVSVDAATGEPKFPRYDFRDPDTEFLLFGLRSDGNAAAATASPSSDAPPIPHAGSTGAPAAADTAAAMAPAPPIAVVDSGDFAAWFYGTLLCVSPRGEWMNRYSVKQRRYIGTTTMVPELSFLVANCARVRAGDIVLDPFCGTGGLLVAAAAAPRGDGSCLTPAAAAALAVAPPVQSTVPVTSFGFDLDGRVMRTGVGSSQQMEQAAAQRGQLWLQFAKKSAASPFPLQAPEGGAAALAPASFRQNFVDYGLAASTPDCAVASFSTVGPAFGCGRAGWLDAIVSDPPYGVRESKRTQHSTEVTAAQPVHEHYNISALWVDLVCYAAHALRPGGRLVFWMSLLPFAYDPAQLPLHPALRLVSNVQQNLNVRLGRRLVVMERLPYEVAPVVADAAERRRVRDGIMASTAPVQEVRPAMDRPVPLRPEDAAEGAASDVASIAPGVGGAEGAEFLDKYNAHRAERRRQREAAAQWRIANGMVQAPKPTRAEARAMNVHYRARNFAAKFGDDMAASAAAVVGANADAPGPVTQDQMPAGEPTQE